MKYEIIKELLPKGPVTSFSLLASSLFLFSLGSEVDSSEWFRGITVLSAVLTLFVVLFHFNKQQGSEVRESEGVICLRDLGFLTGLCVWYLFIKLIDHSYIPQLTYMWKGLGISRALLVIPVAIPGSIVHLIRKIFLNERKYIGENILLFMLGWVNSLVVMLSFLEFK